MKDGPKFLERPQFIQRDLRIVDAALNLYRPAYYADPDPESDGETLESIRAAIMQETGDESYPLGEVILQEAKLLTRAARYALRGSVDPPR